MKILVTGSSGFIGSHLSEYLVKKGYQVVAFDRYNSNNHYGWLEKSNYKNKIKFILGDIRDYDSVNKAMEGCSDIIHLAALIGIPYSYVSPTAYIKTNIEGTFNVLESAKNLKVKQVIVTSTSEVYGTALSKKLSENSQLKAQSPYAASKIAADQLSLSYYRSFGLPVKIIRPFNTFGPRQSARAVIPTIITQALTTNKVKVGNLKTTRDFLYVEDLCSAYEKVMKSNKLLGQVVNVGVNSEISIKNLILKISKILNKKLITIVEKKRVRPKKSEVFRLKCDCSKLKKITNWKPKYKIDQGLIELINWLKIDNNIKRYKPKNYNI
ncbi:MAG: NAD-dependent dehydratase [Candidatus Endolissoclinum sp. TMED37]|nr:MAG: NAD-dependent dehydratase [Candidatus Endolissoclinum sp. TMED37]